MFRCVGLFRWHVKGARAKAIVSFAHLGAACDLRGVALADANGGLANIIGDVALG